MTKVYGYVRVSTTTQVDRGFGLETQEQAIIDYCTQNKLELVHIYKDKGISGAVDETQDEITNRPELTEMLSNIKTVENIVVLNTSRLWRNDTAKVLIVRELKRAKVDVKSIEQPNYSIYKKDPNDFLVNGMMELLDQYSRLEIALKLAKGRCTKAKKGGYAGGGVAMGYISDKNTKSLAIDLNKIEPIKIVFRLRDAGKSFQQIADYLNQNGFTTAKDKKFSKVQVKRILDRKDLYSGIFTYGEIKANGQHEAILAS